MEVRIRPYRDTSDREGLVALWTDVFGYDSPHNEPGLAIDRKMGVGDGLLFVAEEGDGRIVGSVMAGYDGHRGWLYSLAVAPDMRRRGLGRKLVQHAEEQLEILGCLKINLQILEGNATVTGFYQTLGYRVEPRVSMGRLLLNGSADRSGAGAPGIVGAEQGDEAFLQAFEDRSFPFALWNHRAHLKVAYLVLRRESFPDALSRLRGGIIGYNRVHQVPDTPTSGYHETLTHGWLRLIHSAIHQFGPAESADAFFDVQTQFREKRSLLFFYSRDRIMSPEAKVGIVEPDLAPLPPVVAG